MTNNLRSTADCRYPSESPNLPVSNYFEDQPLLKRFSSLGVGAALLQVSTKKPERGQMSGRSHVKKN